MKRLGLILSLAAVLASAPAWADSLYVEGPNQNLTSFFRPNLAVGNVVTIVINEDDNATSGASTSANKDSRLRGDWNFGTLLPKIVASNVDLRGRTDFTGQGTTTRNGKLTATISARIEEVLPNGTLRIVGHKTVTVNEEQTVITIHGIVRPLDISPDNQVDSSRVADLSIDFKGSGPASAKSTPGLLTRLFNWLF